MLAQTGHQFTSVINPAQADLINRICNMNIIRDIISAYSEYISEYISVYFEYISEYISVILRFTKPC